MDFYEGILKSLDFGESDDVLVVCGGQLDSRALRDIGVKKATIANLASALDADEFKPFDWKRLDAENLDLEDGSFDWITVHAGLHHCSSPHRALCEMLRLARKGVVVVESRDSLLMQVAMRLGLTPEYELEPALLSGGKRGGVRNSPVPNFVYRWHEREVEKTARSFIPSEELEIRFFYDYRMPVKRMAMSRSVAKRAAAHAIGLVVPVLRRVLPGQGNAFGFSIERTGRYKPWIDVRDDGLGVNLDYIRDIYDAASYPQRKGPNRPAQASYCARS